VLQRPTYASMYPPAQGAFLAVGQLIGNPWFGVLISAAIMCGAILWALQGWLPPKWALLGGILATLRIGLTSDWVNSYWGGAPAAIGGALVIGAYPRILHRKPALYSFVLGLGAAILANSRPLEGLVFCIPVMASLGLWIFSNRTRTEARLAALLPLAVMSALLLSFVGFYNWRVTRSAFVFPEMLNARVYTGESIAPGTPGFFNEGAHGPPQYRNPQFETFYRQVLPDRGTSSFRRLMRRPYHIWSFFLGVTLAIPLIGIHKILPDRRVRLLIIQVSLSFVAALLVPVSWYFPHYFAPVTATLFILLIQLMRHLRLWMPSGRAFGTFLTRLIVVLCITRPAVVVGYAVEHPAFDWRQSRTAILTQLENAPDRHLILVGYRAGHIVEREWVYNSADIDGAKVVWARIIPGRDLSSLLSYFKDRKVWILDADAQRVTLQPYSDTELKRVLALSVDPREFRKE
jgi:hypothetical protein